MIKVTIELVSSHGREHDRLLGMALIDNRGEARPVHAANQSGRLYQYGVWLSKWAPRERQMWKQGAVIAEAELHDGMVGEVEAFDREKRGAWDLLYLALRAVVGSRNP